MSTISRLSYKKYPFNSFTQFDTTGNTLKMFKNKLTEEIEVEILAIKTSGTIELYIFVVKSAYHPDNQDLASSKKYPPSHHRCIITKLIKPEIFIHRKIISKTFIKMLT